MDQTLRKSNKSIQILLSISAFSLLLSCFPFLPLLCHYFSSFSFQIFSYTNDRKYIFLFCNGILVFLIRNSVLASENQPLVPESSEKRGVAREEAVGIEQEKERGNENLVAEKGKENEILTTQQHQHHQQQQQQQQQQQDEEEEVGFVIIKEEEFFEEEGMELLSAEELNKKCDEFIRKMREGIKFEAQFMVF